MPHPTPKSTPRKLSETRIRILRRLAAGNEGSSPPDMYDLAEALSLPSHTVSAAVWSMAEAGKVACVGLAIRRHPETHHWREFRTWAITAEGREALAQAEGR